MPTSAVNFRVILGVISYFRILLIGMLFMILYLDANMTVETVELSENLEKIGVDKIDNSREDRDKISDGIEQCPIS